ncbi:hypothetical protein BCD64_00055 [Nostoc sp. MBR 210]|nr:hypothetical protein BCD64_00055 [Nostoc sp. MBR 210]
MQNDTVHTNQDYDLHELDKLRKAIDLLIHLEQTEDELSLKLDDARTSVRRRIKGLAIDLGIHKEFINGIK